jgi:hypothetical protein
MQFSQMFVPYTKPDKTIPNGEALFLSDQLL